MNEPKRALVFDAARTGYAIEQVKAMTVGELIDFLQEFDEDMLFILSHDNGYTFGSVSPWQSAIWQSKVGEYGEEWGQEEF